MAILAVLASPMSGRELQIISQAINIKKTKGFFSLLFLANFNRR